MQVVLRLIHPRAAIIAAALLMAPALKAGAQGFGPPPAQPGAITADQDHQNMMDQLHITSLRPGAEGFNKSAPNWQNNDESKANPYPNIPDALTMNDGKKVTSLKMWDQRRKEIFAGFDSEVYGRVPKHTPRVKWVVTKVTNEMNGGISVVTKTLEGRVDNSIDPKIKVTIALTLQTPANAAGPVPVMMEFGFVFPAGFQFRPRTGAGGAGGAGGANRPAPPAFTPPPGPTWQQQCLNKGWGWAVISPTSFQADNGAGLTQGIIGLCNKGGFRKPDDWGSLRAWAWGASRAMDYFETDPAVDAKQVGIEGLSRYGKETLVAMAYEPRFAVAFVGSSGEGGAKLWRRHWGEEEGNLASTGEYHWMAGNFMKYDGPLTVNDLPVDQNELIALCAPRPVFISCGSPTVEGTWLDDKGMYLATALASPAWKLYGLPGLVGGDVNTVPGIDQGLLDGDLAWRQHEGGHTTGPNWPYFIPWASRYIHAPGPQTASAQ